MEEGFKAMRQILKSSAIVLALSVNALIQLAAGTALQSVVGASDAVVIAHIDNAFFDGTAHHVQPIGGLSSFVLNTRVAKDGLDSAEARDEALNPGRQRTLSSTTQPFLHFGPFKSEADEAASVAFWKTWYQQNQGRF